MEAVEQAEAKLRGQAEIWKYMFASANARALTCAVELKIPDIIHTHGNGGPMALSDIATHIASPFCLDINSFARIMRFLVRKNIFTAHEPADGTETLYGLTESSLWLLHDSEQSLAPLVRLHCNEWQSKPWYCFSQSVKEGVIAFNKAYGCDVWDYASKDPGFNKMFNDGMACTARITMRAVLSEYKEGFACIESLVDVGGGTGSAIAEIVKAHPNIKGINFDLPHVVAMAPEYKGVEHVGGDMFKAIPHADAIFLKWIMHDWDDENCIKILKNCREAVPKKTGKVILVDVVLRPEGNEPFDEAGMAMDFHMMAYFEGKERTELEWKKLTEQAGFPRYKIVKLPGLVSLIEAYPQ